MYYAHLEILRKFPPLVGGNLRISLKNRFKHSALASALLRNALLCSLSQGSEAFLVVYCHLSEHLSVNVNVGSLQAVHELAVGKSVHSC